MAAIQQCTAKSLTVKKFPMIIWKRPAARRVISGSITEYTGIALMDARIHITMQMVEKAIPALKIKFLVDNVIL